MANQLIPLNEVQFHTSSNVDPAGRLFWWNGELYRAISDERQDIYQNLFNRGIPQKLIEKGLLIETELTNLILPNYSLVLKHRHIQFVSYPFEWCNTMLKDAALLVIELEIELAKYGLTLQDAHPWNVLFDGYKPVYIDFGSIVLSGNETTWRAYDEYCHFFLYPLKLIERENSHIVRWLLHDLRNGVLHSDFEALVPNFNLLPKLAHHLPQPAKSMIKMIFNHKPLVADPVNRLNLLQKIQNETENIVIPLSKSEWSDYYENFPAFSSTDKWTQKQHNVSLLLSELHPASVLDIGSNRGWYSQLAARLGASVVAFDTDEMALIKLYEDTKINELSILPLVMDIALTSPGYAMGRFPSASERLKCEMVFGLALVHHLVFRYGYNFDLISSWLSTFSKQWVLVEFVHPEDKYVREWNPERYPWYNLKNFIDVLGRYFHVERVLESTNESRSLILCSKNQS